jgi:hypothetical protein
MNGLKMQKNTKIQNIRPKIHGLKNTAFAFVLLSLGCGLFTAGCAEQQQYQTPEPILIKNTNKLQVMEIAEDVLAKMHFTIDKANNEIGYIKTKPLSGAKSFEFWRSDNIGANNQMLSDIHSIRRVVELNITEENNGLNINCNAKIFKLSLPERDINSSARAYELFSKSSSGLQNLQITPEQKADMTWIDLGNDQELAAEILKRIKKQIVSKQTVSKKI